MRKSFPAKIFAACVTAAFDRLTDVWLGLIGHWFSGREDSRDLHEAPAVTKD